MKLGKNSEGGWYGESLLEEMTDKFLISDSFYVYFVVDDEETCT
jgi:hypothetical protein